MSPNWYIVGSPLLLLGVPIILFADRNLDHQRQNMREGKEYVWQENFRPLLGELFQELNRDADIVEEHAKLRSQLEDPSKPDPDGVDSIEDIPFHILNDMPYTSSLRGVTESIGAHSKTINELEEYYHHLETHLRKVGISMVIGYLLLAGGQLFYGLPVPDNIYFICILFGLFGGQHGYKYISKKRELREYADKYESIRDL